VMEDFLERYGMRGPGEFDMTRDRWRQESRSLFTTLAGNLAHDEPPGSHRAHHDALDQAARQAQRELVANAGPLRRWFVGRLAKVHRELMAVREHPKFLVIRVFDMVRTEVLAAGCTLVEAERLEAPEEVWYLQLPELVQALEDPDLDLPALVRERRAEHARHQELSPPRVLTSDGEAPKPPRDASLPPGTYGGTAASAGSIEGVVRVIRDPNTEVLHKGEILVAPYTDPGWTPLFLNAAAVVIEVGGVMTHGSVVAREYGIPAVVCLPDATTTFHTGQRIRVDGDQGLVTILTDETDEEVST
jgi:rifampicin phosphotransferase